MALRAVFLSCCNIDHVEIANLLKNASNLRTLKYSHGPKADHHIQDWNITKFVNAIARETGNSLVELSVSADERRDSIVPGKVSLRPFKKLKSLEFPLMLVMCHIKATSVLGSISTAVTHFVTGSTSALVQDLVPTSVAQLSLMSSGTSSSRESLRILFRDLFAVRESQRSGLQEIEIACPWDSDEAYKAQCDKVVAEATDKRVAVHLNDYAFSQRILWDGQSRPRG